VFDVVPETLDKTTIGELTPGRRVHLEHSATPSTLLGGHVVQGHVDGVGVVESIVTDGEWRVRLRPPRELMEYVAPKGSIALDGVSLTIAALDAGEGWFEVALIPTTLEKTTLAEWRPGSRCNLEMDAFAKMAVHWLKHFAGAR
jgi:riboflavin synthase